MVVEFRQQRKKQQLLLVVVIVVLLITAAILYFGVFRETEVTVVGSVPENLIKEINVDFSVLEDPFFDMLVTFEPIPEYSGEIGRENPFISYQKIKK